MRLIIILITAIYLLCACGTVQKAKSRVSFSEEREAAIEINRQKMFLQTEHYGDTLIGTIPYKTLGRLPIVIPVRSKGIDLELTITDTDISYRSIARPVARSSLRYGSQKTTASQSNKARGDAEASEVKKKRALPWWVWPVGFLLLVVVLYLRFNFNPLSWLKYLKNWKRK